MKSAARDPIRGARNLRAGTYTISLVLVDAAGVASVRRRRVTLA